MEFEFYRNFITIAEEGSITAAAKKLALAQPALSAQVKTLEQYYKVKLLKTARGIRQVELTAAGELFLQKAKRICMTEENLFTEMDNLQKGESGCLSFSISPGAVEFFLEQYLLPFTVLYPKISYEIHEVDVNMQLKHITEGISNFAFANAPLLKKDLFNLCPGEREYLYVVYTEDNKLNFHPQDEVSLQQLHNMPVSSNFSCHRMLRKACLEQQLSLDTVFLATTASAALTFAKNGNAIAIVSGSCLNNLKGFSYQKLTENLYFEQTLFWEKGIVLSACAEKFISFYISKK